MKNVFKNKLSDGVKKAGCTALSLAVVFASTSCAAFAQETQQAEGMHGNVSESVYTLVYGTDPDYIVGEPVELHAHTSYEDGSASPGEASPDFQAGGADHTHQYIVAVAIQILANDFGTTVIQDPTYSTLILEGADYPDAHENAWIFLWHFYNPETEKTYLVTATNTAKVKCVDYFNKAIEEYKSGDISTAMSYIGRGAHYLSDIDQPHHANNLTAVNSNHSAYEDYVDENRFSYYIDDYTLNDSYYRQSLNMTIENFIRSHAYVSKSLKDGVTSSTGSVSSEQASYACVENAQANVAQYLYKFGVAVGIYDAL